MHPIDIQAALKRKQITQKEIAQAEGVSEMAVSLVINKVMVSDRLMRAIAKHLQKNELQVFPEYYNSTCKRRKKTA